MTIHGFGRALRAWPLLAAGLIVSAVALPLAAARAAPPQPLAAHGARADAPPPVSAEIKPWLEYKARTQQFARPLEARIFYRRGLLSRDSGAVDEAIQQVRGAAQLDPHYVAPHLTLIVWLARQEPALALSEVAALVEQARQSFVFQLTLAANALHLLLQALFVAMLAAGLVILVLHNAELRHPWQEMLKRHLSPFGARVWPWALIVLPYLLGLGLVLPTLLLLAMLWPMLRTRERVFVAVWAALLCALPPATMALKRLGHPLDHEQGPLFGVHTLHHQPTSPELEDRMRNLAERYPDNPYVQFGLGWLARQSGDLATAEKAYTRAAKLWPADDRTLNNLGNVMALEGRYDDAVALYKRAVSVNPNNASAYLNLSQVHTRNFDFRGASEAISHAWALDFELIRSAQNHTNKDGLLPYADEWLAPRPLWMAVRAAGASSNGDDALPPAWRHRIELVPGFGIAVVACVLVGLGIGLWQERKLPLLSCSNCRRVVCRRCGERRRASAYCKSCAEVVSGARAYEFAQALLSRQRERQARAGRLVRTAVATLLPGVGLMSLNRIGTPLVMMTAAALLALPQLPAAMPFVYEPHIGPADESVRQLLFVGWVVLYAWSIGSYFMVRARRDAIDRAQALAPRPARRKAGAGADAPAAAA